MSSESLVLHSASVRAQDIAVALQVPRGWSFESVHEEVMDGREGRIQIVDPAAIDDGPRLGLFLWTCVESRHGSCESDGFGTRWPELRRGDLARADETFVRPGVRSARRDDLRKALFVEHLTAPDASGRRYVVECQAMSAYEADLPAWLATACLDMQVVGLQDSLRGDVLAREKDKLLSCPGKTSVEHVPADGSAVATFGPAATVYLGSGRRPGMLAVLILSRPVEREPFAHTLVAGESAVELRVGAPRGQQVTSGRYPMSQHATDEAATWDFALARAGVEHDVYFTTVDDAVVEIIARTHGRVCGRFEVASENHTLRGTFDVTPR